MATRKKTNADILDQKQQALEEQQRLLEAAGEGVEQKKKNRLRQQEVTNQEMDLREQIYQKHGTSTDKIQGRKEYAKGYYLGMALILFFAAVGLSVVCYLNLGFDNRLTLLCLGYLGVHGALLTQNGRRGAVLDAICKFFYVFLFPVMLGMFVLDRFGYTEWFELAFPWTVIAGAVLCVIGVVPSFFYNPYRGEARKLRAANNELRKLGEIADKNVKRANKEKARLEAAAEKQKEKEAIAARKAENRKAREALLADKKAARDKERAQKKLEFDAKRREQTQKMGEGWKKFTAAASEKWGQVKSWFGKTKDTITSTYREKKTERQQKQLEKLAEQTGTELLSDNHGEAEIHVLPDPAKESKESV